MVIDLQRVLLAKVRQLHVLHVSIPIGQYINVLVVSSKITVNGYAWGCSRRPSGKGGRDKVGWLGWVMEEDQKKPMGWACVRQ